MVYEQFLNLPTALIVQIIRKCYPLPYARLRQSCRFLDEFCEKQKRSLGIHGYRKDTHLQLTNSLRECVYCDCCSVEEHDRADSEVLTCVNELGCDLDESQFYLIINHGRNQYDRIFVPMSKEQLPRIRSSLSGFFFNHIIVQLHRGSHNIWLIKVKNHEVWRIFTIKYGILNGGIEVKTARSRHQLILWFIDFIQAGKQRTPIDFSQIYDNLSKIEAIENVLPLMSTFQNVGK